MPHRPQLDGLRAVAVAAVAWSHWEPAYQFGIPLGVGVHLFFVLSGFLITNILLEIRGHEDRLGGIRSFFIRRALRIFPAFYLTLCLAWIGNVPLVRESLAWHAAYLSNVWIFRADTWPGSISHLWSLAVEEQFYLAWPWLIVFAPRRWLVPAIVSCVVAAPLFRGLLAAGGHRETMLALLTPGCMDSLGMGALLAVGEMARLKPGPTAVLPAAGIVRPGSRSATTLAGSAWLALLLTEGAGTTLPLPLTAIKQTLQAVVFGWIVLRASEGFSGVVGRFLSAKAIVYVGKISYGVYLAHGFAGEILATFGVVSASLPEPIRFLALSGVTLGVASLSWHLMERPINALKASVPYTRRPHARVVLA